MTTKLVVQSLKMAFFTDKTRYPLLFFDFMNILYEQGFVQFCIIKKEAVSA